MRISAEDVNRRFGAYLLRGRERAGLTQLELARRAGIGRTTVANMELGAQAATIYQLIALASALGVDPGSLLPDRPATTQNDALVDRHVRLRRSLLGR
ncbi:MAG: helix-turn-helix domain-containing protein [Candidatus Dormibacteria bacterium]